MHKMKNINTRSSKESKVVVADDGTTQIIWMKYFLEAQGYNIVESIVYQDKKSAMLLEKNVKLPEVQEQSTSTNDIISLRTV